MLQALGTKIIVKKIEQEQRSALGIIITNQGDTNPRALVISKGPELKDKHPSLEIGDHLVIEWTQTAQIRDQGMVYYIVDAASVYAKVDQ